LLSGQTEIDEPVKSFLPRPLFVRKEALRPGSVFSLLTVYGFSQCLRLKFQKLGLSASNNLKFFSSGIC